MAPTVDQNPTRLILQDTAEVSAYIEQRSNLPKQKGYSLEAKYLKYKGLEDQILIGEIAILYEKIGDANKAKEAIERRLTVGPNDIPKRG